MEKWGTFVDEPKPKPRPSLQKFESFPAELGWLVESDANNWILLPKSILHCLKMSKIIHFLSKNSFFEVFDQICSKFFERLLKVMKFF